MAYDNLTIGDEIIVLNEGLVPIDGATPREMTKDEIDNNFILNVLYALSFISLEPRGIKVSVVGLTGTGGGGTDGDVNIIGDSVGLNKEATQLLLNKESTQLLLLTAVQSLLTALQNQLSKAFSLVDHLTTSANEDVVTGTMLNCWQIIVDKDTDIIVTNTDNSTTTHTLKASTASIIGVKFDSTVKQIKIVENAVTVSIYAEEEL